MSETASSKFHSKHDIANKGEIPIRVTITPAVLTTADGMEYSTNGASSTETIAPGQTSRLLSTDTSDWYEVKCVLPRNSLGYNFIATTFNHGMGGPFGSTNPQYKFTFLVEKSDHKGHVDGTIHFPP